MLILSLDQKHATSKHATVTLFLWRYFSTFSSQLHHPTNYSKKEFISAVAIKYFMVSDFIENCKTKGNAANVPLFVNCQVSRLCQQNDVFRLKLKEVGNKQDWAVRSIYINTQRKSRSQMLQSFNTV